ncbi:MAG: ATP phosphoribosyltransferase [Candidatus Aminicenantes bacterium]|nr:ATP phosphoribosyltransferase [Candidatus Aminicenantes bacterium]
MKRLKMVVPKGRLYPRVIKLLNDAGLGVEHDDRVYLPRVAHPGVEAKIMKPQNIPKLIELGAHDVGFAGLDWIVETRAEVREILDLGFNPVRVVAAAPRALDGRALRRRKILVASEYENLSKNFLEKRGYDYVFLRTFGATEVFPPGDADMIIDNVSTGRTLEGHGLRTVARLLSSTTRFIAHPAALGDRRKRERIEELAMLFRAVLDAQDRVMLEMNVPEERLDAIVKSLPCMKSPTVAPLHGRLGFAVKIAVRREEVARLIPRLKKMGASDILEYTFEKVVL